jgi:hypothetical protein
VGVTRGGDGVVFCATEDGDAGGEGGVVPVRGRVDGYSRVSGWIVLGKKPILTLPNTFFGPPGNFAPVWAQFRVSRVFGPISPNPFFPNEA